MAVVLDNRELELKSGVAEATTSRATVGGMVNKRVKSPSLGLTCNSYMGNALIGCQMWFVN
ncbi:unnamed protein product [Toxocara canis]|uniref:Uncharacterized protein n=1 Tax=Toxocara canis TaxID=6265 RepID=A0A183U0X6_TOXCA|nr:unnamed protein product [Toxocara canis]